MLPARLSGSLLARVSFSGQEVDSGRTASAGGPGGSVGVQNPVCVRREMALPAGAAGMMGALVRRRKRYPRL